MATNYNIIETVQASAADIVLAGDGQLSIKGAPVIPLKLSNLGAKVAAAAAVARVQTITITTTPAANTRYAFIVVQKIGNNVMTRTISVKTPAGNYTSSVISNQFKTQLESNGLEMTASVGGTSDSVTTITAAAGYEVYSISAVENTTAAVSTAGSYAIGLGSVLNASGLEGFTAANYYDAYPVIIGQKIIVDGGARRDVGTTPYTVYVNIGTDASSPSATSALVSVGYSNVARGFNVNAGVAVPTQAAITASITGAADLAALKPVLNTFLPKIGVDEFNQRTSG